MEHDEPSEEAKLDDADVDAGPEAKGALAIPGKAKKERRLNEVPYVLLGSLPGELNAVTVHCLEIGPGAGGRRRAECQIHQLMVSEPEPKRIERDIAEYDTLFRKEPKKFKETCAAPGFKRTHPDPVEEKFNEAIRQACKQKSLDAFVSAFQEHARTVSAQTCIATWGIPDTVTFEQLNDDTWVAQQTPAAPCFTSLTRTLYRVTDSGGLEGWALKQIRSVPPSADPMCPAKGDSIIDFSPANQRHRELKCKMLFL